MSQAYYTAPEHGWTCYHCGETFRVPAQAAIHFGSPDAKPGCMLRIKRGEETSLLYTLRMIETERDELRVRLVCARLCLDADLEEDIVLRFRVARGVLAVMEEHYRAEKEKGRSKP